MRHLHEVIQRGGEGATLLVLGRGHDVEHLANVFAAEGLLGNLHEQQLRPLIRRVLASDALEHILRYGRRLRRGRLGLEQRREAAEDVPILQRVQLLRVPCRLLHIREVPRDGGEGARKLVFVDTRRALPSSTFDCRASRHFWRRPRYARTSA